MRNSLNLRRPQDAEKAASSWSYRWLEALDTPWERPTPGPAALRADIWIWAIYYLLGIIQLAAYNSVGIFAQTQVEISQMLLANVLVSLPLTIRRRYPLVALLLGTVAYYGVGLAFPALGATLFMQLSYLSLIYAAVAWTKDRRSLWICYVFCCLLVLLWLVGSWTIQGSAFSFLGSEAEGGGPWSIAQGTFVLALTNNLAFYGGGALLGSMSWKSAYRQSLLKVQQEQLLIQGDQLAQDAVLEDRLRIARELHDSVGHHVSAIGIQAAGASRLLHKKPDLAGDALANIEKLATSSVTEMRAALGLLRSEEGVNRVPSISYISDLLEPLDAAGIRTVHTLTETHQGAINEVSQGVSLTLYRILQEALNNVLKHANATEVTLAIRIGQKTAEVEVTDNGNSQTSSTTASSTSYGLRGIKERARALGGSVEIGPRSTQGWRVRVQIPINHHSGE